MVHTKTVASSNSSWVAMQVGCFSIWLHCSSVALQLGCNENRKTYWRYVYNQTDCHSVRISTSEITINYILVVKDFLVFYLNFVELYRAPRTNKNSSRMVRSGQVDRPWNPGMILKKVKNIFVHEFIIGKDKVKTIQATSWRSSSSLLIYSCKRFQRRCFVW